MQRWPVTGDNVAEDVYDSETASSQIHGKLPDKCRSSSGWGAATVPLHMGAPRSISRLSPFMGHRRVPLTDGAFVETS